MEKMLVQHLPFLMAMAAVFLYGAEIATCDLASDRAECTDQLIGLSPCLSYVETPSTATAPTPDCCSGLKQVLSKSEKCLCILVRDRDNPQLGLHIDFHKALSLPSKCSVPANISDCPKLLNLPPNSPDAKVFQQFASVLNGSTPTSNGKTNSTASPGSSSQIKNDARSINWTMLHFVGGVWISLLLILMF